jgi:hypothetical protein
MEPILVQPAPALPPDITVTIIGRDRQDIAEAIRAEVVRIRDQYQGRRAKTQFGQFAHEKAARLMRLANQIDL